MKITYNLEERDLRAFLAYGMKHMPAGRNMRIVTNVLIALGSVYFAVTTDASDVKYPLITKVIFAGIVFLILYVSIQLMSFVFTRLALWRVFTPEKNRGALGEHTISLTDEAVLEATQVNEGKNLWKGIYQIKDDQKYIYIFITHSQAHIIPKRAFPSTAEALQFLQEAKRLHSQAAST